MVSVSPSSVTATIGQSFSIDIIILNVLDLYGWEFRLNWSASLLEAVSIIEGPFLKSGGTTFSYYYINATTAHIVMDCTLLGSIPGVGGSGMLATITFYAKAKGECPLDLNDVILIDSFEQTISCQTLDGYGYFTLGHDVAITHMDISPVTVLPGEIVNINVTAENQGIFTENFNVTIYANSEAIGMQLVSLGSNSSTIIPFIWDTSSFGKGDYRVSASASVVKNETDTTSNNKVSNDIVTILYLGHDLAIISVEPLKKAFWYGCNMSIVATVKNYGIFNETFDTTAYINTTIVQTQTIILASKDSVNLIFTHDTTDFAKGNYTVSVYVWPVLNETIVDDNRRNGGWMFIADVGDLGSSVDYVPTFFAFDWKVDGYDVALFIQCYRGLAPSEAMCLGDLGSSINYVPTFFAFDEEVDGYDLALFIQCYKGLSP